MSGAARTATLRRKNRAANSSPYSRPQKKSGWSLGNIIKNLVPSFLISKEDESAGDVEGNLPKAAAVEEGESEEENSEEESQRAQSEEPMIEEIVPPTVPPESVSPPQAQSISATSPSLDERGTPSENIQAVTDFLAGKRGQALNKIELAGVVSLLQGSVAEEKQEPFRFSTSPSVARSESPMLGSPPSHSAPLNGASQSTRKMLSKNPNGSYHWNGAASAKRPRYKAPGFGGPRHTPLRIPLTPSESSNNSAKRRRVVEEPSVPGPSASAATTSNRRQSSPSEPGPSKPSASVPNGHASTSSGPPSKANGQTTSHPPTTPSKSRLSVGPSKPTTPAKPSPLRQAWGQTDSPSPPHPPPASKPTRAANVLSEMIKEAAPKPKPEFLNPYQAASPVPLKPAVRKPLPRRTRASAAVAATAPSTIKEESKETETDLSPQKIIEATIPRGSKRSRPPPTLEKSSTTKPAGAVNGVTPTPTRVHPTVTIEEVSDEDLPSPPKKHKPTTTTNGVPPGFSFGKPNGTAHPPSTSVVVEEIQDDEGMSTPSASVSRPSQVVEPEEPGPSSSSGSGLQQSKPSFGVKSSAPKAPSKLRYSFQVDREEKEAEDKKMVSESGILKGKEAKAEAPPLRDASKSPPASPTAFSPLSAPFVATPAPTPASSAPKTKDQVRAAVTALPVSELPTYTFSIPTSSPGAGPGPSSLKAREAAKAVSKSSLPTFDFTSVSKSSIPSAPASTSAAGSKGFDFAAAGMKVPTKVAGTWTCKECMCSTSETDDKCVVCGADKVPKPPAPATTSFN
ncbi:hypothetical protein C8Q75DRAFT_805123 [Abortiporus biennis]|nr:hypothetical protein C8Q75DRAFT_805123 [Abortiporus biennis]